MGENQVCLGESLQWADLGARGFLLRLPVADQELARGWVAGEVHRTPVQVQPPPSDPFTLMTAAPYVHVYCLDGA